MTRHHQCPAIAIKGPTHAQIFDVFATAHVSGLSRLAEKSVLWRSCRQSRYPPEITSRHVPCPCHCAEAIVLVPSRPLNHACAIVPCNCFRALGRATVPVQMCLCQGHPTWAIVPAPLYSGHRSTEPSCQCLCHRAHAIVP